MQLPLTIKQVLCTVYKTGIKYIIDPEKLRAIELLSQHHVYAFYFCQGFSEVMQHFINLWQALERIWVFYMR